MLIFLLCVLLFSTVYLFLHLDKKLLILLSLEASFLSMILFYSYANVSSIKMSSLIFLLSSLMVIDSVFSLSILISCGRSSGLPMIKPFIF